jgi:hypothetical protein
VTAHPLEQLQRNPHFRSVFPRASGTAPRVSIDGAFGKGFSGTERSTGVECAGRRACGLFYSIVRTTFPRACPASRYRIAAEVSLNL